MIYNNTYYKIKRFESFQENKKFSYHVTRRKNLKSILEKGILKSIPLDYGDSGDIEAVYLFKSIDDVKNALYNWLGERIEEWEEENNEDYDEVVLKVDIEGLENYLYDSVEWEWTCLIDITPDRILEILEI